MKPIAIEKQIVTEINELLLEVGTVDISRRRSIEKELTGILCKAATKIQQLLALTEPLQQLRIQWVMVEIEIEKVRVPYARVWVYLKCSIPLTDAVGKGQLSATPEGGEEIKRKTHDFSHAR